MESERSKDEVHFKLFGLDFRIQKKRYFILAFRVWLAMSLLLLICTFFFEYEMTNADIPGGFIFGGLLAYLIHILVDQKDE